MHGRAGKFVGLPARTAGVLAPVRRRAAEAERRLEHRRRGPELALARRPERKQKRGASLVAGVDRAPGTILRGVVAAFGIDGRGFLVDVVLGAAGLLRQRAPLSAAAGVARGLQDARGADRVLVDAHELARRLRLQAAARAVCREQRIDLRLLRAALFCELFYLRPQGIDLFAGLEL